jgi:hypothetical protein
LPNLLPLCTCCVCLELRPLPSAGITRFPRYYGPIRHPKMPGLCRHRRPVGRPRPAPWGFPCCARFPCVHAGATAPAQRLCSYLLNPTAVSVFPDSVVGSTCAASFSRLAQRSLMFRPAHSRCHQFVARITQRLQPLQGLFTWSRIIVCICIGLRFPFLITVFQRWRDLRPLVNGNRLHIYRRAYCTHGAAQDTNRSAKLHFRYG